MISKQDIHVVNNMWFEYVLSELKVLIFTNEYMPTIIKYIENIILHNIAQDNFELIMDISIIQFKYNCLLNDSIANFVSIKNIIFYKLNSYVYNKIN